MKCRKCNNVVDENCRAWREEDVGLCDECWLVFLEWLELPMAICIKTYINKNGITEFTEGKRYPVAEIGAMDQTVEYVMLNDKQFTLGFTGRRWPRSSTSISTLRTTRRKASSTPIQEPMRILDRIKCIIGIHDWQYWLTTSLGGRLVAPTSRECDRCLKYQRSQAGGLLDNARCSRGMSQGERRRRTVKMAWYNFRCRIGLHPWHRFYGHYRLGKENKVQRECRNCCKHQVRHGGIGGIPVWWETIEPPQERPYKLQIPGVGLPADTCANCLAPMWITKTKCEECGQDHRMVADCAVSPEGALLVTIGDET